VNESLESRILARTRALQDATHLAHAGSRAKSDFLSNMSHEIRTPMNAVIGLAFLALKTDPDPRQRDYLEKIHRSGQHLLSLVNDILDFSKIESAKAKGLSLSFEIDPSLSRALRGDPLRLGQVLLNYVGNAIKFTPKGSVRVRASMQQRMESGCLIRVEVEDSGIGLTEAQIAQLFQSFHQVDATTTRQYGGTGLGLAVCKQLAELMGGAVGVRSQPGTGSVFWFTSRVRFGRPATAPATNRWR
jgi:signal transduction histidine kinase